MSIPVSVRTVTSIVALVLCAALLSTCATQPEPQIAPTVSEKPVEQPTFKPVDVSGRVVCIDPGHGGPWPGTVSPHTGMRESDLNLQVSLRARDLLREKGVTVLLTREFDTALTTESLALDLAARARFANNSGAALFISLHHNADIAKGSTKDDLEVYYKLGDDGPSLDLGQYLIEALAKGVRQTAQAKKLLPGNYKVLRECALPSVLLETSYLSDPNMAAIMATPEGVDAEAKAVAAGVVAYLGADPPQGAHVALNENAGMLHTIAVDLDRGAPLDPLSVQCEIDGEPHPGFAEKSTRGFVFVPAKPLPNGPRAIRFAYRNLRGLSGVATAQSTINRPPATLVATQFPIAWSRDAQAQGLVEARVLDAHGIPVSDGTSVILAGTTSAASTIDGIARFYLPTATLDSTLSFQAGNAQASLAPVFDESAWRHATLIDARTKSPIANATIASSAGPIFTSTPEGWFAAPAKTEFTVTCRGYQSQTFKNAKLGASLSLKHIADGALIGRRIVLDAMHGGRDAGATGPSGLRSSDFALDTAKQLAGLLSAAGAEVSLTRDGDTEITDSERVRTSERHRPELYLAITYGSPESALRLLDSTGFQVNGIASVAAHYPGSDKGAAIATNIKSKLGVKQVAPCVAYVVQQMSCPAILIMPGRIDGEGIEHRHRDAPARLRAAHQIYTALAEYFRKPL